MVNKFRNKIKENIEILQFSSISIISSGLTAFLPLIVAKLLNPSGFGTYSLGVSLIFFLSAILISSSQAPIIIEMNKELKEKNKINKTFSILLIINFIVIILSGFLFYLFKSQIISFTNSNSIKIVYALYLGFIGYAMKSVIQTLLLGIDKKKIFATVDGIFGITSILMLILLFTQNYNDVYLYISTYIIAGVISFFYGCFFIRIKDLFPFHFNKALFLEIIKFIGWQIIGLGAIYFINWGDNFVLRLYTNTEQIGIYNLSYKLFGSFITVFYFVNSYFLPYLSKHSNDSQKIKEYIEKTKPKIQKILLILIALGLFVIPFLIKILYGSHYAGSIPVYIILSMALIPFSLSVFYIPLFNSQKKYKIIQIASIIQVIINLTLDFILVPNIGIYGSAIATTIGYISLFLIYQYYYKYSNKNHIDNISE